ncbi:MAG: hypothetical protein KKH74_13620 [Gammaproteobacteria bacterium]|nr:hypothetical protein [Gammaproteobacteria bacterium]
MKTLEQIQASIAARNARFRAKREAAGFVEVRATVPSGSADFFKNLAARARAGESITSIAAPSTPAPAPTVPAAVPPETRRLANLGQHFEALIARHDELRLIVNRASDVPRGELVAVLRTLFCTQPVAQPDTLSVAQPDTQPVAPPVAPAAPGDAFIQPTPPRAPITFRAGLVR